MPILMNDVLIKVSVKEKSLIYTEFDLLGFNCSQHLCCLCFSNKVIFAIMCPTRNGWPNPPSQRICQGASKSATIKFASSRLYFFIGQCLLFPEWGKTYSIEICQDIYFHIPLHMIYELLVH